MKRVLLALPLLALAACLAAGRHQAPPAATPPADAGPAARPADRFKPVDPRDYGAVGDGQSHRLTAADLAGRHFVGSYAVGDEWDYVGLSEAAYFAWCDGTTKPNGRAAAHHNRELRIPPGIFLLNKPLVATHLVGGRVIGAGRFVSTLRGMTRNTPVLQTNGCAYARFEGFQLQAGADTTGALFELDWDKSAGGVALQSNTLEDLFIDGGARAAYGLRIGATGHMGSENLLANCFLANCTEAGLCVSNFNALSNTVLGGNIQACPHWGILVRAGSVNVLGTGFQNGTTQQTGADVAIANSANDVSTFTGCRSESLVFLNAANAHTTVLRGINVLPGPSRTWKASAAFAAGDTVTANGCWWSCKSAGTSGAAAPAWSGATVRDGTVVWARSDHKVVTTFAGSLQDCVLPWGQLQVGQGKTNTRVLVENCRVSRPDWLPGPVAGTRLAQRDNCLCPDGSPSGGKMAPLPPSR